MKFLWGKIPAGPSNQRLSGPFVFRLLLEIVITTGLALASLQVHATPPDLEQQLKFDIPRQTADRSLIEFATQAGVTLVFPFDEAAEVTTNRLKGRFTLTDGLTRLLEGTSLASSIDDGQLSVVSTNTNNERGKENMKTTFFGRLLSALTVGSVTAGVAMAQDTAGALEEIIVTAQKREQSLMEVPFSMQALTGESMTRASIRDLQQVMELVPGAIQTNENSLGRRQYSIRGVDQGFSDPTVSYYVDDAAYFPGESFAPIARTFDMSRVEVLRGPQSTLWGASSMGGTVRFITKKPNLENFEAHVKTGFYDTEGGDGSHYTDAAVSVPLIEDKLALRVVGSFEDVGGWTEDALGNENVEDGDITSYRASLLWAASDDLNVRFTAIHNETNQDYGNIVYERDPLVNFYSADDVNENEFDFYSLTFEYDLGWAALINTTTYIDATPNSIINLAFPVPPPFGPPGGILSVASSGNTEIINNEFRLVSQGDSDLQWIAGVFYAEEDNESTLDSNFELLLGPDTIFTSESESISVFGEISYSLMDGRLIPLVGLRYFEEDRSAEDSAGQFSIDDQSFDSVNPRFNLAWIPNDTSNYYLNVVKGFRSGVINLPQTCALHATLGGLPCEQAVDSDELWSYEIGAKFTLLDGQLQLETAVYYMDWQDTRQNVEVLALPAIYTFGDAEIYGVDLSVTYAPASIDGLDLTLVANVADGELTRVDPELEAATGIEEGSDMPGMPDWTLALSANYSWSMGNWQGNANLTYSYIGEQIVGGEADPVPGDSRNLLRGRIGGYYKNFGVFLFGNNLLDEDGFGRRSDSLIGTTGTVDRPRQLGIEITYNFE